MDAADTFSDQHNIIFEFGIRSAGRRRNASFQNTVILCGLPLFGQDFFPPVLHFFTVRKETVATQIHQIAVVIYGPGNTADNAGCLHNGYIVILRFFHQFVSGRDSGRTRSDDNNLLHSTNNPFPPSVIHIP